MTAITSISLKGRLDQRLLLLWGTAEDMAKHSQHGSISGVPDVEWATDWGRLIQIR